MLTVVCPAYNEVEAMGETIGRIRTTMTAAGVPFEIIVVDDGSSDGSAEEAARHGAKVISHPENFGYGAALKTGIRAAKYDWIAITDTDGTYPVEEIPRLLAYVPLFNMVVGARTGPEYRGSFFKFPARKLFQWVAEFVVGRGIPDVNSGLRIFRKDDALRHFHRISGGFSFTTTLTLAAMLDGWSVKYLPIPYNKRMGKSKVRLVRDTLRSGQIIVEAILEYNPIKLFLLLAIPCWLLGIGLIGVGLAYDRSDLQMIAVVSLMAGVLVFGIGLGVAGVKNAISGLRASLEQTLSKSPAVERSGERSSQNERISRDSGA